MQGENEKPAVYERREPLLTGETAAVTQGEIDDVLGDERLSPAERMARLADLRQRLLDDGHADGTEEYAPLRSQVMDALSMLAEGGHDYAGSLRVEGEGAAGRGDPPKD